MAEAEAKNIISFDFETLKSRYLKEKFVIVGVFICIGIAIGFNILSNQAVSDYEVQCGTASSPASSITTKASSLSSYAIITSAVIAALIIIGIFIASGAEWYHILIVSAILFTFNVLIGLAIGLNQTLSIDSNKKIIIGIAITIGFLSTLAEVILLMSEKHEFGGTKDKVILFINSVCLLTIGAVLLSENDNIKSDSTLSNGLKTVLLGASITSVVLGGIGVLIMFGIGVAYGKQKLSANA